MTPDTTAALTAFFYRQPQVLQRDKHSQLRIKPANASFAARSQAVPLVAAEFPEACLEYPIVFVKGEANSWLALAVTGLQATSNAFVNAQGQWTGRYVPASVRRYPFILAEGANDQLSLAVDMAAPHVGNEGEALFDPQGEPSTLLRQLMPLLQEFQSQAKFTNELIGKLDAAGLLTEQNLQVSLADGRSAQIEAVWIVDEAKLRALPDAQVLSWFKGGELALLHAQMLSLRNLTPLLERSQPIAPTTPTTPTTATTVPAPAVKTEPAQPSKKSPALVQEPA